MIIYPVGALLAAPINIQQNTKKKTERGKQRPKD